MTNVTTGETRLAALGAHLSSRGFTIDLTALGLEVTAPQVTEYCHAMCASDTITCRQREDDDGRMWFFDGRRRPIAEADQIVNATVAIKGELAARCTACRAAAVTTAGAEQ
ncbi:hypothetical protein [Streptomyces halstedii]|uniref:hypothetical protein n=1 Tax=Streptomyces halstedii TaxID=1944 RepID=UPI003352CEE7